MAKRHIGVNLMERRYEGLEPYHTEAALRRFGSHLCVWCLEDAAPEDLAAAHGISVGGLWEVWVARVGIECLKSE